MDSPKTLVELLHWLLTLHFWPMFCIALAMILALWAIGVSFASRDSAVLDKIIKAVKGGKE